MEHSIDPGRASSRHVEPIVREVGGLRPIAWLQLGARDLLRTLGGSLGIGVVIAVAGALLMLVSWKVTYLGPAMLGGFLIVAPFIAMPVYVLSRQLERGQPLKMSEAWRVSKENASSIAQFGLMLMLFYLVWERLAAILFAFFYSGEGVRITSLSADLLLSGQFNGLILTFLVLGAGLAAVVFAFSVVSAPLLLDQPVDVITAVLTSLRCCARNPGAMLLWAILIAALTAIGFATLMIGLVVVFPWLAHATWHAYREMVEV